MKKISFFFLFLPFFYACTIFQPLFKQPQTEADELMAVKGEPQIAVEELQEPEERQEKPELLTEIEEVERDRALTIAFFVPESESTAREKTGAIVSEPVYIMGEGKIDGEALALFLLKTNPHTDLDFVRVLASHYINESAYEGINHDVAFSQMCLETGFLAYGGLVQADWNNFCGLGAIGPDEPGLIFPDPQTGVRAHIQHLKAYATEEPLKGELVDPRYRYVRKGSSPAIDGLSGTWATDRRYAVKIRAILQRLYNFSP